jgi:pimeloyl-ACP methyl ester carboxylesterase
MAESNGELTEPDYLNTVVKGSEKPPLVMLHGWAQSLKDLSPMGELISRTREVHLIDLPGFGASPKPATDWDTSQYAERIFKYLEDNGLQNVDLLGHSFGGRVAIRLASKHPERLRSLILINSHGLRLKQPFPKNIRSSLLKIAAKWCKGVDKAFGSKLFENWFTPRYGSRDYKNAGSLRNILVKTVNEDLTSDAKTINVPTFLLWGEADHETPVAIGARFHELIPNSKLTILPGKDHFPFTGEGSHLCTYHVLNFLNQLAESEKVLTHA